MRSSPRAKRWRKSKPREAKASRPARPEAEAPERRCVATGETAERIHLVRCVVSPDGVVVPDVEGKLPGRGLWVSARREAVDFALKKGAFPRAAKQAVKVPPDLADQIAQLLTRRCINLLGLCRRAGLAVAGFVKVEERLASGRVAALVQASDASADGKAKLARQARDIERVEILTSAELGLALGRENVVHAALSPGGLTSSFLAEAQRLAGFRSPSQPLSSGKPFLSGGSLAASGPE